jgi:glutamyl-tRNA reductase
VHELDGCYLYDIDDLEAVVSESLDGRRAEAEVAERLVVEETERFREWRASLDVVPAISALRGHAEAIRAAELAKVASLPADELHRLDQVTAQIVAKLLHEPTVRMKEAAADGGGERTPPRSVVCSGSTSPIEREPRVVVRIGFARPPASR